MLDDTGTVSIGARLSKVQFQKLRDFIGDERMADYLRRLIETDFVRHGLIWPDYEFVDNKMRKERKVRGRGDNSKIDD
jgi:hypothetical protein